MNYFNGFSLRGEERFFEALLVDSDVAVAGFSYGAQQATEYVAAANKRIDRLILLSPAYFTNKDRVFKRMQLRAFRSDPQGYAERFLRNVAAPQKLDLHPYLSLGSYEDLDALLHYTWDAHMLREIAARGTRIEVFLGMKDRIVDAEAAADFFLSTGACIVYKLKKAGHLLQI